ELPTTVKFGSATTIETYSAVATIRKFRHLIRPGFTTLKTDHQALKFWSNFKGHSTGGKMAAEISKTGITISYIKGTDNIL
ncbi:hypothetical protein MMA52_24005, partial [Salmonella enterica]|nr:hypothetical protein [Salmonella enterica]